MLRSTFLKLILWRVQISIEKTIPNIVLSMTASTNIIIYFYSKIRTVGGRLFFNENPYHFHNNTQFCIFVHITKSSFCHVFVTNTAFVTFQDIEHNQEYKPSHTFIIIKKYNFFKWSNSFFRMFFKIWKSVRNIKSEFENIFIY